MKVVSFFDGMGCAYLALKELGMPIESYYAYEIDKHAIKAAKALNSNAIHKGDVRFFDFRFLSGFRTRVSNLKLQHDLPLSEKPDFGLNKHGRKFRFIIHIIENENLELAKKLYRKLQKEETE